MGNSAYQGRRDFEDSYHNSRRHHHHHTRFDNGSHLHSLPTSDAPWNITQWIDPLDPHPRMTSVPVLMVVPRRN